MIGLSKKQNKFTLLFLEEGEIYVRHSLCQRISEQSSIPGKLHICSRSLIFQPQDIRLPILKFFFREMSVIPVKQKYKEMFVLNFTAQKYLRLKAPHVPYEQVNKAEVVHLDFQFENVIIIEKICSEVFKANKDHYAGFDNDMLKFQNKENFDMSRIESITEKVMLGPLQVQRIQPFLALNGLFLMTNIRVYFQPFHVFSSRPVKHFETKQINSLWNRRYKLRDFGLELGLENKSYFFAFMSKEDRDSAYLEILKQNPNCETEKSLENITLQWQTGQLSNFDYLMKINAAAGRTFCDFSQYPVFPWIVADYTCSTFDLQNPAFFRDLSKPMGGINPTRLESFIKRYKQMQDLAQRFIYGTHYSTPGYTIGFLVRKFPALMLKLHGGKFDNPDRLFFSIENEWFSSTNNPADVKELIPEFYIPGNVDFLTNNQGLNLGTKSNGETDVKLPQWASDPQDFLQKQRQALESDYVKQNIHQWIDLVFGYKQTGSEAIKAYNLFHPFTYEGYIEIESIKDPRERISVETQIQEFGQTPKQIFKFPHPQYKSQIPQNEQQQIHALQNSLTCQWDIEQITAWKEIPIESNQDKAIYSVLHLGDRFLATLEDGTLRIFKIPQVIDANQVWQRKSFVVSDLALSCSCRLDERMIGLGCWDNNLYLFNLDTGKRTFQYFAHDDAVSSLCFVQSTGQMASGSWDFTIKLWDQRQQQTINVLYDHEDQITCLDSKEYLLASGDRSGKIIIQDIRKGNSILCEYQIANQHNLPVNQCRFSPRSDHLIALSSNQELKDNFDKYGVLTVNDLQGEETAKFWLEGQQSYIKDFISDGLFAIVVGKDRYLELWDLMQSKVLKSWENVYGDCIQTNGEAAITGSRNGYLYYMYSWST